MRFRCSGQSAPAAICLGKTAPRRYIGFLGSTDHGSNSPIALASRQVAGPGLDGLARCWAFRQPCFRIALFCAMVGDGKKGPGVYAGGVLVAEFAGGAVAAVLRAAPGRLGLDSGVHVHVDSLYPQSDDSLSLAARATSLPGVRRAFASERQLLRALRGEAWRGCDCGSLRALFRQE